MKRLNIEKDDIYYISKSLDIENYTRDMFSGHTT